MELLDKLIHDVTSKVVGFDCHKSKQGRIILIVSLMGKHITVNFLFMNYNAPYNGILGRDWIVPMEVTVSAKF